jgi:hypothetical protein
MADLLGKNILKNYTGESDNSVYAAVLRAGHRLIEKEITLSANNTSANVNVFQVSGSVCVGHIYGEITAATTLTNCTSVGFDAYDGTNTIALDNGGAALSGYGVGTFISKTQANTQDLTVHDNSQVRVTEIADKKPCQPFVITQKTGTNTYIRFNYTTTDAPINATLKFYIWYHKIDGGSIVAV